MTVVNPPQFVQAYSGVPAQFDSEDLRAAFTSTLGGRGGIVTSGALAVTANGTPNMTVHVAIGDAWLPGTTNNEQGLYLFENRTGSVQLGPLAAQHATLNRYSIVYAQIVDEAYAGGAGSTLALLDWVDGTPAGSPTEPSIPATAIQLARVLVRSTSNGGGTITTDDILDRRFATTKGMATALGGIIVTTSGNIPTANLHEGLFRYDTDTDRLYYYNGTAWVGAGAAAAPSPQWFTGSLSNGTATGLTSFLTQNSILVAPYPLTMLVEVHGEEGVNAAANTVNLAVTDEAGVLITKGFVLATDVLTIKNFNVTDGKPYAMVGRKDYAAGATCGFRLQYKVDVSNIYVGYHVKVTFTPKVA